MPNTPRSSGGSSVTRTRGASPWLALALMATALPEVRAAVAGVLEPFGLEGRPFTAPTADRVVLDDLPIHAWRPELIRTLATDYRLAAVFTRPPRLFGVVLPEPIAAHDWRYGHPVIAVYEKTADAPRLLDAPAVP